jgi:hypothetical protein
MADIFISYVKEDHNRLERLANALNARGWSVFWDPVIPAGKTWREVIGSELENARCVIVAWSKKSNTSHWVLEESEIGRERGVLIPVLIDNVLPPLGFRSLQAANLSGWKGDTSDPNFQFLISNLASVLGPSSASGISTPKSVSVSRKKILAVGVGVALTLMIAVLIYSLFLKSWLHSPANPRDAAMDTVRAVPEGTVNPPGTTNPGGSGLSGNQELRDKILRDPAKYQELLKDTSNIKTAKKPNVNTSLYRN